MIISSKYIKSLGLGQSISFTSTGYQCLSPKKGKKLKMKCIKIHVIILYKPDAFTQQETTKREVDVRIKEWLYFVCRKIQISFFHISENLAAHLFLVIVKLN